jgi:carbon monoxide dehydrogenase subunit G
MFGSTQETTIESKIGKIESSSEKVYSFLSDFNNFENLVPQDKISNWNSTEDTCSFSVTGVGEFGMKIIEKEPHKLIKISNDEKVPFNFYLWVQLKEAEVNDTRIKITIKAQLNPMLKMAAQKPLQQMVDTIVDQLGNSFKS